MRRTARSRCSVLCVHDGAISADDEERHRKYEAERREWIRKEAERQRLEHEAAREKGETITKWRLARDVRAYVTAVESLVREAGLEITGGGNADEELTWALAYADRIDPVTSWRESIARVKAERNGATCSRCGTVDCSKHDENMSAEASSPIKP
jgi:hypothetical protein